MVINELEERQNPAPEGFNVCGNFNLSQDAYYEKRAFVPGSAQQVVSSVLLVMWHVLVLYIVNLLL